MGSTGTPKKYSVFCRAKMRFGRRSRKLCFKGSTGPATSLSAKCTTKIRPKRGQEIDI
jgi:hypothetical protein